MKGILILFLVSATNCFSQVTLRRQADWGARFISLHPAKAGMEIRGLQPGSAIAKGGLLEGDVIMKIDDVPLSDPYVAGKIIRKYREGDEPQLEVIRKEKLYKYKVKLTPMPLEEYANTEIKYGSVITEKGHHLRTMLSRPKGNKNKLPVIFLTQWLSCDQVEINTKKVSIYDSLLFNLISGSGYAFMRVEKPGLGDSEGPDCTECDYESELEAYRAAFRALKQAEGIDTNAIFIFGWSIGASSAPLVFHHENIKGMIVTGGFSKTWFEHMLEIERNRLMLSGLKPGEITALIKKFSEFYDEYLNHKKSPGEIIKGKPHLQGLWYDGDAHQYERPAVYYQQVQDKNVAAAWQNVKFPVLVIYGEYDWIMSRADHREIADIVNGGFKGNATFVEIPKMSHNLTLHPSLADAYSGANASYASSVYPLIMDWIRKVSSSN